MKLFDNLRMLPHVPGVQMQRKTKQLPSFINSLLCFSAIPDDGMDIDRVVDEDKDSDPDKRISQVQSDRRVADERELSDSEDEDGDQRRDQTNFKRKPSTDGVNGNETTENGTEKVAAVEDNSKPATTEAENENVPADRMDTSE